MATSAKPRGMTLRGIIPAFFLEISHLLSTGSPPSNLKILLRHHYLDPQADIPQTNPDKPCVPHSVLNKYPFAIFFPQLLLVDWGSRWDNTVFPGYGLQEAKPAVSSRRRGLLGTSGSKQEVDKEAEKTRKTAGGEDRETTEEHSVTVTQYNVFQYRIMTNCC